jgi:hypothetical protein
MQRHNGVLATRLSVERILKEFPVTNFEEVRNRMEVGIVAKSVLMLKQTLQYLFDPRKDSHA